MTQRTSGEYTALVKALASFAPHLPKFPAQDAENNLVIYIVGQKDGALTIPYDLIRRAKELSVSLSEAQQHD